MVVHQYSFVNIWIRLYVLCVKCLKAKWDNNEYHSVRKPNELGMHTPP